MHVTAIHGATQRGAARGERTVPSCTSVSFIEQALTSHRATVLPLAVASRPLGKNTVAFTCAGAWSARRTGAQGLLLPIFFPRRAGAGRRCGKHGTTFSCSSTVDEPAFSALSSPSPSRDSIKWSPAPAAMAAHWRATGAPRESFWR